MKNTPCATDVKQCASSIWSRMQRPTVRQSLHYEISLLPDPNAARSDAFKLRLGGTHVCPLWKPVLIAVVALITIVIACKCKCKCKCERDE